MKILLSGIRDRREDFNFRSPVRLESMGDRAGEGEAELWVSVDPAEQRWTVNGRVEARFPFRCDRCNRPFAGRLAGEFRLVVLAAAPGDLDAEAAEDLIVLPPGSQELDLTAPVLEALWLDLPIQLSCEAAGAGACPGPPGGRVDVEDEQVEPDPRWGPLAELKRRLETEGEGPAGEGGDSGKD